MQGKDQSTPEATPKAKSKTGHRAPKQPAVSGAAGGCPRRLIRRRAVKAGWRLTSEHASVTRIARRGAASRLCYVARRRILRAAWREVPHGSRLRPHWEGLSLKLLRAGRVRRPGNPKGWLEGRARMCS